MEDTPIPAETPNQRAHAATSRPVALGRAMALAFGAAADTMRARVPKPQRGFALLMVLGVVAILGALSVQFTFNTRSNIWMSGNLKASTQAYYNARSSFKIALLAVNAKKNFPELQKVLSLMGKGAASRIEIWSRACDFVDVFAGGEATFFGTKLLDFSSEVAVGSDSLRKGPDGKKLPGFTCKVLAEDGRANLNAAATDLPVVDPNNPVADPGALTAQQLKLREGQAATLYTGLKALLTKKAPDAFKSEDEMVDLILNVIDWTDADKDKSEIDQTGKFVPSGTGGEFDYGRYGYEAKNAKMDTVAEVQLVEGMTPDIYCRIQDDLTVFATKKLNVNDASVGLLEGVLCNSIADDTARAQTCLMPGLSGLPPMEEALIALDACRNLKKQVYSTPFTSMTRFTQFFEQFPTAMQTNVPLPVNASILNQQLGVKTDFVRIEATGLYGDTTRRMVGVVNVTTGALVHFHYE